MEPLQLVLKVSEERFGAEGFTTYLFHQLFAIDGTPEGPQMLAKPLAQALLLPSCH